MKLKALMQGLLSEMRQISQTDTVVGEPILVGQTKLIPINRLSMGFGFGAGSGDAGLAGQKSGDMDVEMEAVGGGLRVHPMAFIAVDEQGAAQLLSFDEPEATVLDKLLQVAPELAQRLMQRKEHVAAVDDAAPPEQLGD